MANTLSEVLLMRAASTPERLVYRFLPDNDAPARELTYAELHAQASAVARALGALERPGARVLVLCPPGLDYIAGLWGCFLAGMVAVPALPPRFNRSSSRFEALLQDAEARVALVTRTMQQAIERVRQREPRLAALALVSVDALPAAELVMREGAPDELAVLQYTSGSTSSPRGVMLTHAHLLENCRRSIEAAEFEAESQLVSWLPPYHDMGLIGTILLTPVAGCRATMMSPFSFVTRPLRWLDAISRYRGTHAGAPDFGFSLCARRVTEVQKQELDLASWRIAWNGAERVRPATLDAFVRAFGDAGFARGAMRPCYGLAEATLMVSFAPAGGPRTLHVSSSALRQHAVRAADEERDALSLVSVGRVIGGHELRVVEPHTRVALAADRVGELWVRGPSVAAGYFERAELSPQVFGAHCEPDDGTRWLRTGDLGFIHDGELFVTGRLKDVLIVRGRNYYPDDLEFTVQSAIAEARAGCGAAFAIERGGEERVCLVQEVDGRELRWEALAARARAEVFAEHELVLHDICWVAPGKVPKTSSGKVQRSLVKQRYLEGSFEARFHSAAATEAPTRPSPLEPAVAAACRDLLGIAELDREEDLFALGVSSVLAMQLSARLEQALGVQVPLRQVFEAPTVAQLARALEAAPRLEALPPLEATAADAAPLSLAQERMWFEHALDPMASAYNVAGALRLRGPLAVDVLARALAQVVARHPILRARYDVDSASVVQRLSRAVPPSLTTRELRDFDEAQRHAERLARAPFDLTRDPVIRLELLRVREDDHLLVTVIHHIAADGLSIDLLLDEGFRRYAAERVAGAPDLPAAPPGLGYLDFARWQRETLHLAAHERSVAYFRERLAGAPTLLSLPTDKPRPPRRSLRGALVQRELSPTLLAALDGLGQQTRATRYMTLLSAFYVLLARSSGERDLCVGTPVHGRQHAETESVVGTFINMLVMRCVLAPDESLVSLLARVRSLVLEALEHQAAPFERVVEAVAPTRSQAHTPLFQVMFDYQVLRRLRSQGAGLELEPVLLDRGGSQYDLSCSIIETGAKTFLHLEYRSDLFEHASAERLADRYLRLLESALVAPTQPVDALPWLSPSERADVLALGRGPEPSESHPGSFLANFEAWTRRAPDAPAASDDAATLSYAALDARANQLAHVLRARGVGPEVAVGVYLERSVELLVALLAVLKAGGCYVPLDPGYPRARIAHICESAEPRTIITAEALLELLPMVAIDACVLERERAVIEAAPHSAPDRSAPSPEQLAYIIYTSGSTGRPKGVEVPHGALANFLHAMAREPGLGEGELLLAVTTVSFDIAALELFLPLTVGGHVEIASRALAADGPRLAARLALGDVRCFQATPATYRMLLEAGFAGAPALKLLCGGEALPRDLASALLARGAALYNMYGPTETTVWSACAEVVDDGGPVPLGRAIDNTTLYVLDERRELVPRGVVGELYIGGAGVARGYHGQPALSAERFVPDPFADAPARLYRTGDAARFAVDGGLEFFGRVDQQIKLRGFRIELGEVEAKLAEVPSVEACAVKLSEPPGQEARLVAYVVARAGQALEADALRAALRRELPDYMLPSDYIALRELPRTPNGKLDRSALPEPAPSARLAPPYAPPTDEVESLFAALFEEVLGRERVSIHESFFDLGGHSILAVRLFEGLFARTGVRLPLATLFEASSVAELGRVLRARDQGEERGAVRLVRSRRSDEPPRVVFVHPQGTGDDGALAWYGPLSERLDCASVALACDEDAFLELTEVATRHAAALRKVASARPLCLVGVGLAGNLAQELAVQLEASEVPVRAVVAVQSVVPGRARGALSPAYLGALGPNLWRAARTLREAPPEPRAMLDALSSAARSTWLRPALSRPELEAHVDRASLPLAYGALSAPQWNALLRHAPRPCRAPIFLVRGHRSGIAPRDEVDGFAGLSHAGVQARVLDLPEEAVVATSDHPGLRALLRELLAG